MLSVWLSIVLLIIVYKLVDFVLRLPGDRLWATRRCILVTGCGSGFGQQFVSRCAARKCTVFAACRTAESVTALKLKAAHQNGDIKPFVMDVTSEQSVLDGFNYVCRNLPPGGLWAVVNNAGVPSPNAGPLEWSNVEDFKKLMEVNFFGLVRVTKTFLPLLKKSQGRIVNITSAAGRIALARMGPYSSSKFAAEAFSDIIRQELRPCGVSVHVIEPGHYKTAMTEPSRHVSAAERAWKALSPSLQEEYGEQYYNTVVNNVKTVMEHASENTDDVIQAYENAVFAWYPRSRYLVGKGLRIAAIVMHFPEWFSDAFLNSLVRSSPVPAYVTKMKQKKSN